MIFCFKVLDPQGNEFDSYTVNSLNEFNSVKTFYNDETIFNYKDFNFRLKTEDLQLLHKILHNKQYPELEKQNFIKLTSSLGVIVEINNTILNQMNRFGNKLIQDSYSIPKYLSFIATDSTFVRHFLELFLTIELTIKMTFVHITPNNFKYILDMVFTDKEFCEFEKLW